MSSESTVGTHNRRRYRVRLDRLKKKMIARDMNNINRMIIARDNYMDTPSIRTAIQYCIAKHDDPLWGEIDGYCVP